jgi:putative inorganic carbon (hco3(-)) transporter
VLGSTSAVPSHSEKKESLWQERVAYRMLILFLALLYITPGTLYPQLENFPIAKGVIFFSFIFLFSAKRIARTAAGKSWRLTDKATLWLLAFTVVEGVSILGALWQEYALSVFINALKLLVAYLLIINLVDDSKKVRQILWILVLAAMVPALGTIYHYIFKIDLVEGYRAAWIGVYSDPNDLAFNLVVLIPILLVLFESEKKWILKGILLSQLATFTAAIYVTSSRGGLVGLLVVLVFLVLRSNHRMLHFSIGSILFLILLAAAPARYWERAETIINFQQDESAMGRVYAWRAGLAMLQDRPLLGVGVGCFVMGWPIYAPPEAGTKWRAPHNTFIQVMGENGLLGSITFFAFLATAIRGLQKFNRSDVPSRPLFRRLIPSGPDRDSNPNPNGGGQPSLLAGRVAWNRPLSKKGEGDDYARGLEIALWGFLACSLTLGIARSWPPYIFIGLAIALRQIRQNRRGETA